MSAIDRADRAVWALMGTVPVEQALDAARDSLARLACALQDEALPTIGVHVFAWRARLGDLRAVERVCTQLHDLVRISDGVCRAEFDAAVMAAWHLHECHRRDECEPIYELAEYVVGVAE